MGAAAAGAGDADAGDVNVREGAKEVEGTDGVPRLETEDGLEAGFSLGAEEAPVGWGVEFGALFGEPVGKALGDLETVSVAEHVVVEDDAAHSGELNAAGLEGTASGGFEALGTGVKLTANVIGSGLEEAAVFPVAMRGENRRAWPQPAFGTVKVPGDKEAREALEIDFFYGVIGLLNFAVDDGLERRSGRHGPEAGGDQEIAPNALGADSPFVGGVARNKGEIAVEVLQGAEARVVGELAGGKNAERRDGLRLGGCEGRRLEEERGGEQNEEERRGLNLEPRESGVATRALERER